MVHGVIPWSSWELDTHVAEDQRRVGAEVRGCEIANLLRKRWRWRSEAAAEDDPANEHDVQVVAPSKGGVMDAEGPSQLNERYAVLGVDITSVKAF